MDSQDNTAVYEVFGANMTIDIKEGIYSMRHLSACKSCQCHCHLCRGHRMPIEIGTLSKKETENALEKLLVTQN